MNTNLNMFPDNKGWIEKTSAIGVFEKNITEWIEDCKNGSLSKEDVLNVTKKVAEHRKDFSLVEEITQRLN